MRDVALRAGEARTAAHGVLSDVVFGSAVGMVVGHTVTMHTLRGHEDWAITPMPVPGGGIGVMVSLN